MKKKILSVIALGCIVALSSCAQSSKDQNQTNLFAGLFLAAQNQGKSNVHMSLSMPISGGSSPLSRVSAQGFSTQIQSFTQDDVTRVTIEITGPDISGVITYNLVKVSGAWEALMENIPVGENRVFTANAYDVSGTLLYTGDATGVSIVAGSTAQVYIKLQESSTPAPITNIAPVIDSFALSGVEVGHNEQILLAVTGHDDNAGDTISYEWIATGGTFNANDVASPEWTAPASNGVYTLTVNLRDSLGAIASMSVDITVDNGQGGANTGVDFNNAPAVTDVYALPTRIDINESTTLGITVSDVDNDPLTYAWTSACGGNFSDASLKEPQFTAPAAYPADRLCTLSVLVSDGQGGQSSGSITIHVREPVSVDPIVIPDTQAPTITGYVYDTNVVDTTAGEQTINLTLTIADNESFTQDANGLNFALNMSGPGNTQYLYFSGVSSQAEPGSTDTLRTFKVAIVLPQGSAAGIWSVGSINVADAAGNSRSLSKVGLDAMVGHSTDFTNGTNSADTEAPVLKSFSVDKTTVDTSSENVDLTFTVTVEDNLALPTTGSWNWDLWLFSPSRNQHIQVGGYTGQEEQPGSLTERTFIITATLPVRSEGGDWVIENIRVWDNLNNTSNLYVDDLTALGYPTVITNTSTNGDTTPAEFSGLSFDRTSIDTTSAGQDIIVTVTVTDDIALPVSGWNWDMYVQSPSGTTVIWSGGYGGDEELPSSTTSRTFISTLHFPQGSEAGDWKIGMFRTFDNVGHYVQFSNSQLIDAGYDFTFTVQ